MRKISLFRSLLLCMVCIICMGGMCSAKFIKDDDGNWVEYYRETDRPWNIFFIDTNAIKVREYEGKKYLDISIRRKEEEYESYWAYQRLVEVSNAKFHIIYDIENCKGTLLEYQNKYANPKRGTNDISTIKTEPNGNLNPIDRNLVAWVEQNRPDIIKEIRTFNSSNTPSAGAQTVTAGDDYGFIQTLGNGPVQYSARMIHTPPTQPVVDDGIWRSYVSGIPASGLRCRYDDLVPPVAPDTGKSLYIIYRSNLFNKTKYLTQNWIYGIFSYDDETNTFTLYDFELKPFNKIHIVDRNNIEVDFFDDIHSVDGERAHFTYEYTKTDWLPDVDGNGWERTDDFPLGSGKHLIECPTNYAPDGRQIYNEVGLDGLFAFLACKGNVGYAPSASSTVEYVDQREYGF